MGFVFVKKGVLEQMRRQLDVARPRPRTTSGRTWRRRRNGGSRRRRMSWWRSMPRSTSSPPEGGQAARLARYHANSRRWCRAWPSWASRLSRPLDPGADHRDLPCAGGSGTRSGLLRAGARQGLHPLSRASSRNWRRFALVHRRDRSRRDAPCGQRHTRHAGRNGDPQAARAVVERQRDAGVQKYFYLGVFPMKQLERLNFLQGQRCFFRGQPILPGRG